MQLRNRTSEFAQVSRRAVAAAPSPAPVASSGDGLTVAARQVAMAMNGATERLARLQVLCSQDSLFADPAEEIAELTAGALMGRERERERD